MEDIMDRITITSVGKSYLQQNFSHTQLPTLPRNHHDKPTETATIPRHSSKGKLNVASLRTILRDDTINEVNRLKEHTRTQACLYIRQELMKDISGSRPFLNAKAESMTKKMMGEYGPSQQIQSEIGKGRNYLCKLVGEHELQRSEDERLRLRLREKVRGSFE